MMRVDFRVKNQHNDFHGLDEGYLEFLVELWDYMAVASNGYAMTLPVKSNSLIFTPPYPF